MRPGLTPQARAVRDAVVATVTLGGAVWAGSGRLAYVDPALFGYLGATFVAAAGTVYRASAFWRRPASAVYARALGAAVRHPATLRRALASGARDLGAQRGIARRSRTRWLAHLLLAFGTLASLAITLPLVLGWLHFAADGQDVYRVVVVGMPAGRFALDGAVAWLVFHALSLAAVAVATGAATFLALRLRARRLPGVTGMVHVGPLVLLLAVAGTGLALPASRGLPRVFPLAAVAHEIAVVLLLIAVPFSKLVHVLIRPLQVGVRLVRAPDAPRVACVCCGGPLAPAAQRAAVAQLLAAHGIPIGGQQDACPACRRRGVATAQAALLGAHFQPPLTGTRPVPRPAREEAA
ncbi:MAG: hypothetical protein U0807_11025 [Candidatus Binatia bacterium]